MPIRVSGERNEVYVWQHGDAYGIMPWWRNSIPCLDGLFFWLSAGTYNSTHSNVAHYSDATNRNDTALSLQSLLRGALMGAQDGTPKPPVTQQVVNCVGKTSWTGDIHSAGEATHTFEGLVSGLTAQSNIAVLNRSVLTATYELRYIDCV